MMNAGIFLVPAVHEIAIAAELAIPTRATQKPDTHPLTDRPALDTGTKRVDPPDELVAWDPRPIDGELALYRAGIRVADPTRLDTNPDLTRRGRRPAPPLPGGRAYSPALRDSLSLSSSAPWF